MGKRGDSDITEIGPWSEVKLQIIREYAKAYSVVLSKQSGLTHLYIDAFAGAGVHQSRESGDYVLGSPSIAVETDPPFVEYHFVDLSGRSIDILRGLLESGVAGSGDLGSVSFYNEDCNEVLLSTILPRARYDNFRRALCLLDPYGLDLDWGVVEEAGRMRSIELFVNFPIHDMNRNVLWRNPDNVDQKQIDRMDRFWGDRSWKEAAYSTSGNLFGFEEKQTNDDMVRAYRQRLKEQAGFKCVPEPLPMRNSNGAVVYYLFFASPSSTGLKIVNAIFDKYRS